MENNRLQEIKAQCQEYHNNHPEVWNLFVRFSGEVISKGYSNYSVNAIFERIRWEMDVGGNGKSEFKINNNYRPLYARRFMRLYPDYDGFFRTRKQTSEDAPPTNRSELTPGDYDG